MVFSSRVAPEIRSVLTTKDNLQRSKLGELLCYVDFLCCIFTSLMPWAIKIYNKLCSPTVVFYRVYSNETSRSMESIYKVTLQYIDILFTLSDSTISSYQADFQHT